MMGEDIRLRLNIDRGAIGRRLCSLLSLAAGSPKFLSGAVQVEHSLHTASGGPDHCVADGSLKAKSTSGENIIPRVWRDGGCIARSLGMKVTERPIANLGGERKMGRKAFPLAKLREGLAAGLLGLRSKGEAGALLYR